MPTTCAALAACHVCSRTRIAARLPARLRRPTPRRPVTSRTGWRPPTGLPSSTTINASQSRNALPATQPIHRRLSSAAAGSCVPASANSAALEHGRAARIPDATGDLAGPSPAARRRPPACDTPYSRRIPMIAHDPTDGCAPGGQRARARSATSRLGGLYDRPVKAAAQEL